MRAHRMLSFATFGVSRRWGTAAGCTSQTTELAEVQIRRSALWRRSPPPSFFPSPQHGVKFTLRRFLFARSYLLLFVMITAQLATPTVRLGLVPWRPSPVCPPILSTAVCFRSILILRALFSLQKCLIAPSLADRSRRCEAQSHLPSFTYYKRAFRPILAFKIPNSP